jgi:hypothetical protein
MEDAGLPCGTITEDFRNFERLLVEEYDMDCEVQCVGFLYEDGWGQSVGQQATILLRRESFLDSEGV